MFYGFSHGVNHHFSPPFGECFSTTEQPSTSLFSPNLPALNEIQVHKSPPVTESGGMVLNRLVLKVDVPIVGEN